MANLVISRLALSEKKMKLRKLNTTMKGFTLIELMVVVAILGIISAIAYSSYRQHIQTTNRKAAIAEMQVVGQALERYYTTNNGTYAGVDADGKYTINSNAAISDLAKIISNRLQGYTISVEIRDSGQGYGITARKDDKMGDPTCGDLTIDSYGGKKSTKGSKCFR